MAQASTFHTNEGFTILTKGVRASDFDRSIVVYEEETRVCACVHVRVHEIAGELLRVFLLFTHQDTIISKVSFSFPLKRSFSVPLSLLGWFLSKG